MALGKLKSLLFMGLIFMTSIQGAYAGVPLLPGNGLDIKFPATEALIPGGGSVAIMPLNPIFTSDSRYLFVGTMRTPSAATIAKGYGFHLNKIETATGKIVGDIPLNASFPTNKIKAVLGNFNASAPVSAVAGKKHLAIVVTQDNDNMSETPLVKPILTDFNGQPSQAFTAIKAQNVMSTFLAEDERHLIVEVSRSAGEGENMVDEINSQQFCVLHIWDTQSGKQVAEINSQQLHPQSKTTPCSIGMKPYYTLAGNQLIFPRFPIETTDEYGDDEETAKLEQAWLKSPKVFAYNLGTKTIHPLGGADWQSMFPVHSTAHPDGKTLLLSAWPTSDGEEAGFEFPRLFSLPDLELQKTLNIKNPVEATMLSYTWSPDKQQLLLVGINNAGILFSMHYDLVQNRQLSFYELPIRTDPGLHGEGWDAAKGRFVIVGHARQGSGLKLFWI